MNESIEIDYTNIQAIDWIKNYFGFPQKNIAPTYRILWLGQYIKTHKGKTVWERQICDWNRKPQFRPQRFIYIGIGFP